MRGWGQFEEVEDVSPMSSVNNPHKGKSILVTLAARMDVVHVCVCGGFFFFFYIRPNVCVLSLFSLSLLIITGLRARISLSAGQPCHISSKQAPSPQKALDNSPQPWPLKQKPVLHSSIHILSFFSFFAYCFFSPPSFRLPLFSSTTSLLPLLWANLCLSCLLKVFSPLPKLLRSVWWEGGGAPAKKNLYVVFSYFFFKAGAQSCCVLMAVNNSVSGKPPLQTPPTKLEPVISS